MVPLTSSTQPNIPIESEVQGNSWKSVDWDMLIRSLCVKLKKKNECSKIHDYIYSRFQPHIKEEQYLRTRTSKFN